MENLQEKRDTFIQTNAKIIQDFLGVRNADAAIVSYFVAFTAREIVMVTKEITSLNANKPLHHVHDHSGTEPLQLQNSYRALKESLLASNDAGADIVSFLQNNHRILIISHLTREQQDEEKKGIFFNNNNIDPLETIRQIPSSSQSPAKDPQLVLQNEINNLYTAIDKAIRDHKAESLTILAGEVHDLPANYLVQRMILDVAKEYGFKSLILEISESRLSEVLFDAEREAKAEIHMLPEARNDVDCFSEVCKLKNEALLLLYAEKLGFTIVAGDIPNADQFIADAEDNAKNFVDSAIKSGTSYEEAIEQGKLILKKELLTRDEAFAKAIATHEHPIMIMGEDHVSGVVEFQEVKDKKPFIINLTHLSSDDSKHTDTGFVIDLRYNCNYLMPEELIEYAEAAKKAYGHKQVQVEASMGQSHTAKAEAMIQSFQSNQGEGNQANRSEGSLLDSAREAARGVLSSMSSGGLPKADAVTYEDERRPLLTNPSLQQSQPSKMSAQRSR